MMTRRRFALVCPAAIFGMPAITLAADPWTARKPEDWTDKDKHQILTRSPWAKQVDIDFGNPADGGFGPPGGGGPGGGGPPGGGPPGGGFPGGGGPGGPPEFNILVRWNSALPVQLASKNSPDEATDYYLVFMSLPTLGNRPDGPDEQDPGRLTGQLKSATSLQRKGKDPIYPDRVETAGSSDQRGMLFSFPRTPDTIAAADKEVTFVSAMGPLHIRAKFNLKEMTYQGRLEL